MRKLIFCLAVLFSCLNNFSQTNAGTCDVHLMLNINRNESPILDLSYANIQRNIYNVPGSYLKAGGNVTIYQFIHYSDTYVFNSIKTYLLNRFNNNADTAVFLCLDIETPVAPKQLGNYSGTRLDSIIEQGFKRRINFVKKILPKAKISLYGICVPDGQGKLTASEKSNLLYAKSKGMFDSLDYVSPVLYCRWHTSQPNWNNYSKGAYNAMIFAKDTLNVKPLMPLMCFIIGNGSSGSFNGTYEKTSGMQQMFDTIRALTKKTDRIVFWDGGGDSAQVIAWQGRRDTLNGYFHDSILYVGLRNKWGITQMGNMVTFKDSSSLATNWSWNFGDGTSSNLKNQVHTYKDSTAIYQACLTISDKYGCQATKCIPVSIIVSGIRELNTDNSISIYPNPFNSVTTITINSYKEHENYSITLLNGLGQEVKRTDIINTNQYILSKDDLSPGLYFISIITKDQKIVFKKIIIN